MTLISQRATITVVMTNQHIFDEMNKIVLNY